MKKIRIALVGCGSMMRFGHLPYIKSSDLLEPVLACDIVKENAEAVSRECGVSKICTDWRDVINYRESLDLVLLATHTDLRAKFIVPALESGLPVYVEKPLAATKDEAVQIYKASRRTSVPVCIGHNRRSAPAIIETLRLIKKAKRHGTDMPCLIDRKEPPEKKVHEQEQSISLIRINDDLRTWKKWIFSDPQGIMFAEMVHFIDLAMLFHYPAMPVKLYAQGSASGNFTQVLGFSDGSISTIQHTCVGNFDAPKELYEFTAGNVTIVNDNNVEVRQYGLSKGPKVSYYELSRGGEYADGFKGIAGYNKTIENHRRMCKKTGQYTITSPFPNKGHLKHLELFALSTIGRGQNPCDVHSAIVVNNIALKLLKSSNSGIPIKVESEDINVAE